MTKEEVLDEEKPILHRMPGSRLTPEYDTSPFLSHSPLTMSSSISESSRPTHMDLDVLEATETGWDATQVHSSRSMLLIEEETVQDTPPPIISDMAALPNPELANHLIDLYFKHHYPQFPVLQKQTFLVQFQNPAQPTSALLLCAIYATAARYSNHPSVRQGVQRRERLGMTYFDQATQMLDRFMDAPRVSTVQALVLMAIYESGLSQFTRPFVLIGMAVKMAQLLGLQRRCEGSDWQEAELRKRVFWSVYLLDRLIGSVLGQPMLILDKDCDVELPSLEVGDGLDEMDEDEHLITVNYVQMIKLNTVFGNILQHIYSPQKSLPWSRDYTAMVSVFESSLAAWVQQLPPHLEFTVSMTSSTAPQIPSSSFAAHLHLLYYEILILLHRPFLQFPNRHALMAMATSLHVCTNAANNITQIAESILTTNTENCITFPFTTYSISVASTIHCLSLNSKDERLSVPAKTNLMTTIRLYKLFLHNGILSLSATKGVQNLERFLWSMSQDSTTATASTPASPKLSNSAPSPTNRVRRLVNRFETSSESDDSPDAASIDAMSPGDVGTASDYWQQAQQQRPSSRNSPALPNSSPRQQLSDRPPSRLRNSPRPIFSHSPPQHPQQIQEAQMQSALMQTSAAMPRSATATHGPMTTAMQDGELDPQFWNEFEIDWEALDQSMTRAMPTTTWGHHAILHEPGLPSSQAHFTPQTTSEATTLPVTTATALIPLFAQPGQIATGVSNLSLRSPSNSTNQPPPYPTAVAPTPMGVAVAQAVHAPPKPPRNSTPPPSLPNYNQQRFLTASPFTRRSSSIKSNSSGGKGYGDEKVNNAINFVMGKSKRREDSGSAKRMSADESPSTGAGAPGMIKFDSKNVKFMNLKFPPKVNQNNKYW